MKRIDINVFIFRRDLRVEDNLALDSLIRMSKDVKILPIFIFNQKQINPKYNEYYSKKCCEFMIQCLKDLNLKLKDSLCYFFGSDIDVLKQLLGYFEINNLAFNLDYTPYARNRDSMLIEFCNKNKINLITQEDYTLLPMDHIKPYKMFTPFYRNMMGQITEIPSPLKDYDIKNIKHMILDNHSKIKHMLIKDISKYHDYEDIITIKGGREHALTIFDKIKKGLSKDTGLSPYMKFGCVSVRECFDLVQKRYGNTHDLIRQLIWREFYAKIVYNNERVLQGKPLKDKYDDIKWDDTYFDAWKQGKTGFPIVDAAMRQLKKEGFLNNRLRMIVASFAVKDLMIDWRMCERYYATQAIDYDPCSNNGGWQSTAGVGTDTAQPYFRILNPWIQSLKYDKDCVYIKKWISELNSVSPEDIHRWFEVCHKYDNKYPKTIVDHKVQVKKFERLFK